LPLAVGCLSASLCGFKDVVGGALLSGLFPAAFVLSFVIFLCGEG
jgi:hypothetical protein